MNSGLSTASLRADPGHRALYCTALTAARGIVRSRARARMRARHSALANTATVHMIRRVARRRVCPYRRLPHNPQLVVLRCSRMVVRTVKVLQNKRTNSLHTAVELPVVFRVIEQPPIFLSICCFDQENRRFSTHLQAFSHIRTTSYQSISFASASGCI